VTPSGLLIEAPAEPQLAIGAVAIIEVEGLRGLAVAENGYPASNGRDAIYALMIIEHDDGLLSAIASCVAHGEGTIRFLGYV